MFKLKTQIFYSSLENGLSLIGYSAKFLGYEIFPLETSQIKANQKRNI